MFRILPLVFDFLTRRRFATSPYIWSLGLRHGLRETLRRMNTEDRSSTHHTHRLEGPAERTAPRR